MEFKGTKADWNFSKDKTMVFAGETHIVSFPVKMSLEQIHDIRLIKHAPKLLDALQEAVNGLEWYKNDDPVNFDKADDEKLFEWKKLISEIL